MEDKKRRMMEEMEIGGKKKKIPFKERMGICGCGLRRTGNGGWIADWVLWRATADR